MWVLRLIIESMKNHDLNVRMKNIRKNKIIDRNFSIEKLIIQLENYTWEHFIPR